MREGEAGCVQELAPEAEVSGDAVDRVARDRQADRREVDADLVRPPGLQAYAQEGVLAQKLERARSASPPHGA